MRRKPGAVLPIELSILENALELRVGGVGRFHGFQIAGKMKQRAGARLLTSHGTLYKALDRMEQAGLLESVWEDPLIAAEAGRPRRRLYEVTAAGEAALASARAAHPPRRRAERRLAPL
jgi:DNA-binding PadR family transcriptional regulator